MIIVRIIMRNSPQLTGTVESHNRYFAIVKYLPFLPLARERNSEID